MPEQFDSHYFRGQGALFLGDLDANGNPSNLLFIGDVTSADLTPEVQRSQVVENVTGGGAIGASWIKSTTYQFAARLRSVKPAHLAEALQASNTAKAAASVTDETHTANHDRMIRLLHAKVSAVVVTNSAGTTTYTENSDYIVHADEGLVEILSGGNIPDASDVLIDYAYAAQHHLKVSPANLSKCLVFTGINTTNGKRVRSAIYRIKLDPSVLSYITDEATDMPLSGQVEQVGTRPAGDQLYSWEFED